MNLHFNQPANKQRFTNLTPHSTKQNHKADSVRHSVSVSRCKNQNFLMKNSKKCKFFFRFMRGNNISGQSRNIPIKWLNGQWLDTLHFVWFGWQMILSRIQLHLPSMYLFVSNNASLFHRFVDQMATIWHLLTEKELYRYFWYAFPPNVNIHVFSSSCTNHPPNVSRSVVVWEYRRVRTICSCNWRSALCVEAENNNK